MDIYIACNAVRLLLIVLSIKWPWICKTYLPLNTFEHLIFWTVPTRRGYHYGQFVTLKNFLTYASFSYSFFPSFLFVFISQLHALFVVNHYIYKSQMPLAEVLPEFISITGACYSVSFIFKYCRLLIYKTELTCSGNELLLSNLKDGIIVLSEPNNKIKFVNNASACVLEHGNTLKRSLTNPENKSTLDIESRQFALVDNRHLRSDHIKDY